MLFRSTNAGFMGATPIVGGTVPLAVGSAWADSLFDRDSVTVVFFGDGCFEEGVVHESLNFATLHSLPVVFICENNDFSVYTRRSERQPSRPIFQVAEAHGLSAVRGDGNDVCAVSELSSQAIKAARRGQGPQFLEFETYRWREHCGPDFDDHLQYRTKEEVEVGQKQCPIQREIARLKGGLEFNDGHISALINSIDAEIEAAFKEAISSPTAAQPLTEAALYA